MRTLISRSRRTLCCFFFPVLLGVLPVRLLESEARAITFCRDGVLDPTGRICCSPQRRRECGAPAAAASRAAFALQLAMRPECRSVGALDCRVPNRTSTRDERLLYRRRCGDATAGTLCVAVLLTGHMRTFRKTAPALRRALSGTPAGRSYNSGSNNNNVATTPINDNVELDLVVATYRNQDAEQPRFHDKTRHSTSASDVVSGESIEATYRAVADWRAVWVHIYDEDEIGAVLPRDLKRQAPNLASIKKEEHVAQVTRVKRALALVQQGVAIVRDLAEHRGRRHDLVVRLRPDIELLAPLNLRDALAAARSLPGGTTTGSFIPDDPKAVWQRLRKGSPRLAAASTLIVPTTYDPRGGLGIRASQLATRPCARNGSLVPTWVQDHLAIATLDAMLVYARFYHAYLKPHIFSAHVETALAKYLGPLLRVVCIPIKYTVRR